MQIRTATATLVALLAVIGSAAVFMGSESSATYTEDYGTVYPINLAPGFSYTYTPTYPSDLSVTTTIEKYESDGLDASMTGSELRVTVRDGVTSGSYDLILKAYTNTADVSQTAYQHIRFNIVQGLTVSGVINDIIKGAEVELTPTGTSVMGDVVWTVKSGTTLPDGLTLADGVVSGTPTTVGKNTVSLTATANGESKDLIINFTVYNVILGGDDETILSYGNTVSSTAIEQTGSDLGVNWTVSSGTIPEGFTLDATTGVVSGSSTTLGETTITLTGSSTKGPAQTATKELTIRSEPALTLAGETSIATYVGNTLANTLQISPTAGTSTITWTVTEAAGVSIADGLLSVAGTATAGTVTVTATTAYGQVATKEITIIVESAATITGADKLSAKANGSEMTALYKGSASGIWVVDKAQAPPTVTVTISELGVLSIKGTEATSAFDVTVQLTTDGGQRVTKTVTCQIVSSLEFTSAPINGLIVIEM